MNDPESQDNSQEQWPSVTLDTRQVNLMAVTREFVAAQLGG